MDKLKHKQTDQPINWQKQIYWLILRQTDTSKHEYKKVILDRERQTDRYTKDRGKSVMRHISEIRDGNKHTVQ